EVDDVLRNRRSRLQRRIRVHLTAARKGTHAVGPSDSLVDILSELFERSVKEIPARLEGRLLVSERLEFRHSDGRTRKRRPRGHVLLREPRALSIPFLLRPLEKLKPRHNVVGRSLRQL